MVSERQVRNKSGIIIGWVKDYGDQIQAISLKRGFVGHYNKAADLTFDRSGKLFSYGDATDTLVRNSE